MAEKPRQGDDLARRLHDRIRNGLEWVDSSTSREVRDALLALSHAAFAKRDVAGLEKLLRQVQILARSVGVPIAGVRVQRTPVAIAPPESAAPSPARWAAVPRPAPFPRRRAAAPLRYPWGDEPPPRPRSSSDVLPGTPECLLSAGCRERLAAYRRSVAARGAAESEARQLYGRVRYQGPDEPPEWYWPMDPE
jgi:hypothetical protein